MEGESVLERLKAEIPDLRVLFVSGYNDVIIRHRGLSKRHTAFLEKPFSPKALAPKVREVLDLNL